MWCQLNYGAEILAQDAEITEKALFTPLPLRE